MGIKEDGRGNGRRNVGRMLMSESESKDEDENEVKMRRK